VSIQMQLWSIEEERPVRLRSAKLDLENRLETWICQDLGLVGEDLLLLDSQVATDYGHWIDVLALDREGNLVILELKRGRTPRDVVAQILDYASWAHNLTPQDVERLAAVRQRPLAELFRERFGSELPESLNEEQRLVIVATELDPQSERIVQFLSSRHGVNINVVFFDYYRDGDREYVGRSWLIAPSEVERSARTLGSGKRARLTLEDLVRLADDRGVGDLYRALYDGLKTLCDQVGTTKSNVSFRWRSAETGSRTSLVSVYPNASDSERGLVTDIRVEDLARQFRLTIVDLRGALPARLTSESAQVYLYAEGYAFRNREEIARFVAKLRAAAPGAIEPS
jgi:hypothetical protein